MKSSVFTVRRMEMAEKEFTIEEGFGELEKIIAELEKGDLGLEDSFKKYEKGLEVLKSCDDSIGRIEERLKVITKE